MYKTEKVAVHSEKIFFELSDEILGKDGKCLRFRARGESMVPFIRNGEMIKVISIAPQRIKAGDIIFYRTGQKQLVIHRVIRKKLEKEKIVFITKGDHSFTFDQDVDSDNILGKVVAVEKKNRIIQFDKGLMKLLNALWAKISPFNLWIYPPWRILRQGAYKILRFMGWPTL